MMSLLEEEDVLATQSILMDMSRMESFHEASTGALPPMLGSQHDPSLVASPRVLTLEQLQHLQRSSIQQPPQLLASYGAAGDSEPGARPTYQPRHILATPASKKYACHSSIVNSLALVYLHMTHEFKQNMF